MPGKRCCSFSEELLPIDGDFDSDCTFGEPLPLLAELSSRRSVPPGVVCGDGTGLFGTGGSGAPAAEAARGDAGGERCAGMASSGIDGGMPMLVAELLLPVLAMDGDCGRVVIGEDDRAGGAEKMEEVEGGG